MTVLDKVAGGTAAGTAGPAGEAIVRAEAVMGTVASIDIRPGACPREAVYLALARARAVLQRADAVFSTWKPQSPMSRLRRGEITLTETPPEVAGVLERCRQVKDWSGGWFDPWAMPGGVDPTGLVKGWAAARALDVLVDAGISAAMIGAGGDVATWGQPEAGRPWRLGVQDPLDRDRIVTVAEPPGAIATSGTYERGQHVVDPRSGQPVAQLLSASVTGPALDVADGLATGLIAGGLEALSLVEACPGYEAFVIDLDGAPRWTAGFPFAT